MLTYAPLTSLFSVLVVTAASAAPSEPTYAELGEGQSAVWIDLAGVGAWSTDRAPVAALSPLVMGLGYSHRIGDVRLAWRVDLFTAPGGARPLRFLYVDLLSIERILADGWLQPWWRVGLGLGLDLEGAYGGLGATGFFNEANGASAGFGLAHGWGLDAYLTDALFIRTEVDLRAYTGAGRGGLLWASHLGAGVRW